MTRCQDVRTYSERAVSRSGAFAGHALNHVHVLHKHSLKQVWEMQMFRMSTKKGQTGHRAVWYMECGKLTMNCNSRHSICHGA